MTPQSDPSSEIRYRKDGRPLVTNFAVAGEDWVDYVDSPPLPDSEYTCRRPSEPDEGNDFGD